MPVPKGTPCARTMKTRTKSCSYDQAHIVVQRGHFMEESFEHQVGALG